MRLPIIVAGALVGISLAYRYFVRNEAPTVKSIFSWSFILITLSIIGNTPIAQMADLFSYVVILIILLNDGYDIIKGI